MPPLKVLFIAPEYPPGNSVGYMRVVKFEKYLSKFDIATCCLTLQSYGSLPTDQAAHVFRAWDAGMIYRPFTRFLFNKPKKMEQKIDRLASTAPNWSIYEGTRFNDFRKWLLDTLAVPDMQVTWLPFAIAKGFQIIRSEKVDVIFSTSSPETAHLVAYGLSKLTGKPWVADFRDGWLFEPLKKILRRLNWRQRIEQRMEQLVVAQAHAVTTVSKGLAEYFIQTYSPYRSKVHIICNGYDPDDWAGIEPVKLLSGKFRIVHTGTLFLDARGDFNPLAFLQALQNFPPEKRDQIELILVGDLGAKELRLIASYNLDAIITFVGRVSWAESLAYQLSADVLLLLAGTDRSVATSKLFEYLYAHRPILALSAPNTAAAEIILDTQSGLVVSPVDTVAIEEKLMELYQQWQSKSLSIQSIHVEQFNRQTLTGKLAQILRLISC